MSTTGNDWFLPPHNPNFLAGLDVKRHAFEDERKLGPVRQLHVLKRDRAGGRPRLWRVVGRPELAFRLELRVRQNSLDCVHVLVT
jgi:hypothetical protein